MKSLKGFVFLIGICCGAWWLATPANAVTSDVVWINGSATPFATADETTENGSLNTTLLAGLNSITALGLYEPNDSSVLSDVAWVDAASRFIFVSSDLNGTFPGVPSDILALLTPLTVNNSIAETGQPQNIGAYFGLDPNALVVQSDVSETPLPAALPLFATGLGALGLLGWRRKRKAAAAIAAA